ncbi:MAG: hypothetical protein ACT4O0_01905 [Pseudonocardia sp.]
MIQPPAGGGDRAVAGVLGVGAVLFVGFAATRVGSAGFVAALSLPLVLLAAALIVAAAVLTRWYPIRPVAQGLAVFGLLVHALVALRGGPVWTRGCSAVLAVVHGWALIRLFLITAAEEDDSDDRTVVDEPAGVTDDAGYPVVVETPVSDVVDLPAATPVEPPGSPELRSPHVEYEERS